MKNKLFNPVFLFLASLILPLVAFEALINEDAALSGILSDIPVGGILFGLFAAIMALIAIKKQCDPGPISGPEHRKLDPERNKHAAGHGL